MLASYGAILFGEPALTRGSGPVADLAGTRASTRAAAMQMHQIRYFLVLAEELNFTRSAARCNVAQPSLTRAIKGLEDELGGPLFQRERAHTRLTELGKVILPYLEDVYRGAENARRKARELVDH